MRAFTPMRLVPFQKIHSRRYKYLFVFAADSLTRRQLCPKPLPWIRAFASQLTGLCGPPACGIPPPAAGIELRVSLGGWPPRVY